MRRRVFLMRHADVTYVEPDGSPVADARAVKLTARGEAQADAAGKLLAEVRFDRVITSGLLRTRETARRVLAGRTDAPAIESVASLEEIRTGNVRDLAPAELEEAFLSAFRGVAPETARFLGGESVGELYDRVLPSVTALLADRTWDTALWVLHGGVNRAILSWVLTGKRTFLGHLEQDPACVNVFDVGDAPHDFVVRTVNLRVDDPLHAHGDRKTTIERLYEDVRGR